MKNNVSDKERSILLFKHFIGFLEIWGQENYGENIEIDWFKVYNFTSKYDLLDLREDLEDIVFEENEELKEEFAFIQESQRELMFDIAFFIMEKTGEGEQDIFKLLADMYSVPVQEISELGFNEMLEAIMNVIKNEEIQKGFLSIFK